MGRGAGGWGLEVWGLGRGLGGAQAGAWIAGGGPGLGGRQAGKRADDLKERAANRDRPNPILEILFAQRETGGKAPVFLGKLRFT